MIVAGPADQEVSGVVAVQGIVAMSDDAMRRRYAIWRASVNRSPL